MENIDHQKANSQSASKFFIDLLKEDINGVFLRKVLEQFNIEKQEFEVNTLNFNITQEEADKKLVILKAYNSALELLPVIWEQLHKNK